MTVDTQKLLSLFDTAAQAHGWASDQGTRAQAQTALANYQRARGDLEQALDAQTAKIAEAESQADRHRRAAGRWKKVAESAEERVRDQAAKIERLRDALEWYAGMSKQMGKAAIRQDSQSILTLMKEIAVDYGKRASAALSQGEPE